MTLPARLAGFVAACAWTLLAAAHEPRTVPEAIAREQVLAAEDARFAAMIRADAADLGEWLAEDLQYVHSSAVVETRAQLLDSIASGRIRYLAVTPADRQVVLLGAGAAIVRGRGRFQVAAGGAALDLQIRYLAVYSERGGRWRLRSWQSLRIPENAG